MKRLLLAFVLFWSSVAWGQVEVRRYNTLTELLSANPSGFSVAGRATVIVTGNTNLLDGTSRILAYSASDTGAVDNVTIFAPANTNFPGRYRLLKPGFGFSDLTNAIAGGTNVTLTYATGPDRIMVNSAATGSSFQFRVEDLPYTNINVVESSTIDPSVSFGTNLAFGIKNYSVTLPMLATINPESLMGFGQGSGPEEIRRVSLGSGLAWSGDTIIATGGGFDFSALTNALIAGANITFDISTNTLTINATGGGGGTNGTAVTVDGGADLTRANFADSSEITFSVSGTNVTAGIPNDSIALGTKTTGNFVAGVVGTANEVTVTGGSGSEASTATLSLPATLDLGGKTSFEIPNGASPTTDAFGEIAGDNDAWGSGRGAVQFFDGTANTLLVGVLASDTPVNGQVPVWNTGGTITWETATGGGGIDTTTNYTWTGTNTFLGPVYLDTLYVTNLLAENLQVPFTNALVYANGSSNLAAVTVGSGLSFSGGTLSAAGGSGSSTNLLVNGLLVTQANLTDSANVLWEVTGSDIRAILTNVSGGLTINSTPVSSPVLTNGPQLIWDINGSVITPILTNVGSSLGTNGAFAVAAFWDPPGDPEISSACELISADSVGVIGVYREEQGLYRIDLQSNQPVGSYKRVEQAHISDSTGLLYESGVISNATYSTSLTNVFVYVRQAGSTSNYGTNHPVYLALYSEPAISGGGGGGDTQTWKYLTVDQATTSTTPQNITNLVFSIGANEVWTAEWYLGVTVSGPTGMGFALDVPTGATLGATVRGSAANATVITADATLSAAVMTSASGAVWGSALVQNGTNAGSVQLQFGSITNTVTSTIKGNQSYMVARRISP